jgi:hypothetical protein
VWKTFLTGPRDRRSPDFRVPWSDPPPAGFIRVPVQSAGMAMRVLDGHSTFGMPIPGD